MASDPAENLRELPLPQLVTPKEAAIYLRCSEYTVRARLKSGTLKGKKNGAIWTIRVEDLRRHVTPDDEIE